MTDTVPAVPTHRLPQALVDAARAFDPQTARPFEHEAEQQRQATVERFPRDAWSAMGLMDYVQGQDEVPDNSCWWIEHNAVAMGSIRGGSARKLIIYKRRTEEGFYFPPGYSDVTAAWDDVRGAYVEAFGFAERGGRSRRASPQAGIACERSQCPEYDVSEVFAGAGRDVVFLEDLDAGGHVRAAHTRDARSEHPTARSGAAASALLPYDRGHRPTGR
jgi:hypothetical protein